MAAGAAGEEGRLGLIRLAGLPQIPVCLRMRAFGTGRVGSGHDALGASHHRAVLHLLLRHLGPYAGGGSLGKIVDLFPGGALRFAAHKLGLALLLWPHNAAALGTEHIKTDSRK